MPDSGHVIDCAHHLALAHGAYRRMLASGDDGGRALRAELDKQPMDHDGVMAAKIWSRYLTIWQEEK